MGFDLDNSVTHRIAIVASLARRLAYRSIGEKKIEITPDQWTILYYLWKKDGLSISEIVSVTKKNFPNVTRIVEKLVELGYVEKRKDEIDKRSYRIYLLPKSEKIRNAVDAIHQHALECSVNGLSVHEQEVLLQLLNRIENNIFAELEDKE